MIDFKRFSRKSKLKSGEVENNTMITCEVILLDPTQSNFKISIKSGEQGCLLFNKVCDRLGGILEKDYFGLKYNDKHGQQQWLELNRPICKQIKGISHGKSSQLFSFRFKHYPRDPNVDLKQNLTKYLMYLQLRRDLYRGRLVGSVNVLYRLAALVLQVEIGALDSTEVDRMDLPNMKILPSINLKAETKILDIYDSLRHLDNGEAEKMFLNEVLKLETYGVEPIAVKDQRGNGVFVGITYEGISTYSGSERLHTFPWKSIQKVSFSHKVFMVQVVLEQKKHILGFKCQTSSAACALWKWAFDRKCFLTLEGASEAKRSKAGGGLFRRKKSHTFSGRSQLELSKSYQTLQVIPQPTVVRSRSLMTLQRGNHFNDETSKASESRMLSEVINYATLPRSEECDFKGLSKQQGQESLGINNHSAASTEAVLDFMQSLSDTPTLQRFSRRISNSEFDFEKSTDYSLDHSMHDDDDTDFFSEGNEVVNRDLAKVTTQPPPAVAPPTSDDLGYKNNGRVKPSSFPSEYDIKHGILPRVVVSMALFCVSVVLVVFVVAYSRGVASYER